MASDRWCEMYLYWIPVICIAVSFIAMVWQFILSRRNCFPENRRIKELRLLASGMVFVWSVGFGLYMYAISHCKDGDGNYLSAGELLFRSAIDSLNMFMFNIDGNVFDAISGAPQVRGWISLCVFVAGILTLWFIIVLIGARIWASIKSWWSSLFNSDEELCVFFGINEPSKILAKSIVNNPDQRKFRLIFVEFPLINENEMDSGWGSFVKSITHKVDTFKVAKNYHARLALANTPMDKIRMKSDNGPDHIFQRIGLSEVAHLIRHTNNRIHLFFLSDSEINNIRSVSVLKNDLTIIEKARSYECKFYCHARYNSIHRVVEDEHTQDNMIVKVVDSSHICVEMLKQHVELQPVSYVSIEKDATVSSPFNALVVGFSEVGLEAVRFLYEFGAFVKTGSTNNRVERSDFHCHVVDKNMSDLAGLFVANAPSVQPSMPFKKDEPHRDSQITLHQMDSQSVDFYWHLEQWIKKLNYVVVTLDDDETNISLAVRIFRLAIRYRDDMENFRILVRIRHDEDNHICDIAEHYNRLWAAEMHSTDKKKRTHQKEIAATDRLHAPITLFGSEDTIYTYEYIINEKLENNAKLFKERYDRAMKAMRSQSGGKEEEMQGWENEQKDLMQLVGDYKGYSPTYSGMMRLRRIQSQNFENCYHLYTKKKLAMEALGENYSILTQHQLSRKDNDTTYVWKEGAKSEDSVIRVLDVLAQTEHLRWNASHEILGYRDNGTEKDKDEARLQHGCLKPWQDLSTFYHSYDYNIVDVSLDMV